jgi:hypothetical protein
MQRTKRNRPSSQRALLLIFFIPSPLFSHIIICRREKAKQKAKEALKTKGKSEAFLNKSSQSGNKREPSKPILINTSKEAESIPIPHIPSTPTFENAPNDEHNPLGRPRSFSAAPLLRVPQAGDPVPNSSPDQRLSPLARDASRAPRTQLDVLMELVRGAHGVVVPPAMDVIIDRDAIHRPRRPPRHVPVSPARMRVEESNGTNSTTNNNNTTHDEHSTNDTISTNETGSTMNETGSTVNETGSTINDASSTINEAGSATNDTTSEAGNTTSVVDFATGVDTATNETDTTQMDSNLATEGTEDARSVTDDGDILNNDNFDTSSTTSVEPSSCSAQEEATRSAVAEISDIISSHEVCIRFQLP